MRKKILASVSLLMSCLMLFFSLASCGVGGSDSLEIEKITAELLNDGSGTTRITIKYFDDIEKPLVFDIPMGLQGETGEAGAPGEAGATGNGIKKIEVSNFNEQTGEQTLQVTFTDEEMDPMEFKVKNGTKISSVTREDLDGEAYLVIKYSDETESRLPLPKGADGAPGVGINNVAYQFDAEGNTLLYLVLSDEEGTVLNPVTIKMGPKGDPGVGVTDVSEPTYVYDDDGNVIATKFHFILSDEGATADIEIPAGLEVSDVAYRDMLAEDGVTVIGKYVSFVKTDGSKTPTEIPVLNGVGVDKVENAGSDANGNTLVNVTLTDGTVQSFTIPSAVSIKQVIPSVLNGQTLLTFEMTDGHRYNVMIDKPRSIEDIEADTSDPNNYVIVIKYSDNTEERMSFPKTNAAWITKAGAPRNDEGNVGDYWFNTAADVILYKESATSWVEIVNFNSERTTVTVTFRLDAALNEYWAGNPGASLEKAITINKGECFATSPVDIPIPTRDGFVFKGWYATNGEPNPIINSAFTDLTVVPSDITLYPYWVPASNP